MQKFLCACRRGFLCFLICFLVSTLFSQKIYAHKITPSDVFQATEELRLRLDALGLIDMHEYGAKKYDDALRHPRHVLQKARACNVFISKILISRNIEALPLPHISSKKEVTPHDVMASIDHLISEIDKLEPSGLPDIQVESVSGKVPNDVYNNLKNICSAIKVEVTPNEVYRITEAVHKNVTMIVMSRNYRVNEISDVVDDADISDVYQEVIGLFSDLHDLSLHPDYAIPGGVVLKEGKGEDVTQRDILSLMYEAYAEVEAIEYAIHIDEEVVFPDHETQKTNSDVLSLLHSARSNLRKIIEMENKINSEILDDGQ